MRKKLGDYALTPEDLRQIAYFFSIVKASQKIDRLLKEQKNRYDLYCRND